MKIEKELESWLSELKNVQILAKQGEGVSSGILLREHIERGVHRDISFREAVPKLIQMITRALEMSDVLGHRFAFHEQFQRILNDKEIQSLTFIHS